MLTLRPFDVVVGAGEGAEGFAAAIIVRFGERLLHPY